MLRFIFLSFGFLGWAFYEVSGGTDFSAQLQAKRELAATQAAAEAKAEAEAKQAAKLAQAKTDAPVITDAMVTRAAFSPTDVAPVDPASSATQTQPAPADPQVDDPAIQTVEAAPLPDIRKVAGSRVNMRMGPSTSYNVVARLTRNTRVRVLQEPGNGWVKLKVEESGRVGWMAARLLTKVQS